MAVVRSLTKMRSQIIRFTILLADYRKNGKWPSTVTYMDTAVNKMSLFTAVRTKPILTGDYVNACFLSCSAETPVIRWVCAKKD